MTNEVSFPHMPPGPIGPGGVGEACPNPEMLSAYLDDKLDGPLRAPIEDHISRCEDCYFVVRETAVVWGEGSEAGGVEVSAGGAVVNGVFRVAAAASVDRVAPAQVGAGTVPSAVGVALVTPAADKPVMGGSAPSMPMNRTSQRSLLTRYLLPMAAALIVGAGSIAVWRQSHIENTDPRADLVAAVGERRFFDARLTGGFRYGDRISPKRGGSSSTPPGPTARVATGPASEDWEILAAAVKIKKGIGTPKTVEERATLASAHLVLGEIDDAIRLLEKAIADPEDQGHKSATLFSDLAAAYLTRAFAEDRADDYPRALDNATHAVEIDPALREALYNKALALEAMYLPLQAETAWKAFLLVEPDARWREEGQRRRDAVRPRPMSSFEGSYRDRLNDHWGADKGELDVDQARVALNAAVVGDHSNAEVAVRASVDLARDYFEGTLLREIAEGGRQVSRLATLGEAYLAATGDDVIALTAAHFQDSAEQTRLRAAFGLFVAGRANFLGTDWTVAERQLRSASRTLDQLGSPLSGWANLYLAILALQGDNGRSAEQRINGLIGEYSRTRQSGLVARALYVRSILLNQRGDWDGAFRDRLESERRFDELRDVAWAGFLAAQRGELLSRLGRTAVGWEARRKSLRSYRRFADPGRRVLSLMAVADDCRRGKQPYAAVEILAEAQARAVSVPLVDTQASVEYGLMTAWAPINAARARSHYERARSLVNKVEDPKIKEKVAQQLDRLKGEVSYIFGADQGATLDKAIIAFSKGAPAIGIAPRVGRARLHLAAGQYQLARADFEAGLDEFDRSTLAEGDLRWSQGVLAAQALEGLIALDLAAGAEPADLLHWIDDRADLLAGQRRIHRAKFSHRLSALGPQSGVLVALPLEGRLLVWWISDRAVRLQQLDVSRSDLRVLSQQLEAELASKVKAGTAARRLWQAILEPWAEDLEKVTHLHAILQGPLASVPLAYVARGDGRLLLEQAEVTMAQRIGDLSQLRSTRVKEPILIVRQRGASKDLAQLPATSIETSALKSTFKTIDSQVPSPTDLLAQLAGVPTLHFSGHALINPDLPFESSLVLSVLPGQERYLRAREIAAADLRHLDLVVLAACSTADAGGAMGEERLALAHAFLNAGARNVVATLRSVTDAGAAQIIGLFYRALATGVGPASALRSAQRELRDSTDASSFVVFSSFNH